MRESKTCFCFLQLTASSKDHLRGEEDAGVLGCNEDGGYFICRLHAPNDLEVRLLVTNRCHQA